MELDDTLVDKEDSDEEDDNGEDNDGEVRYSES
jgi:hypothetical protein